MTIWKESYLATVLIRARASCSISGMPKYSEHKQDVSKGLATLSPLLGN